MSLVTRSSQVIQTDELVWEEPPAAQNSGKYAGVVTALKENPGKWAIVQTFESKDKHRASGVALRIKKKGYVDFREGQFDAVARTSGGTSRVYVRFVGN